MTRDVWRHERIFCRPEDECVYIIQDLKSRNIKIGTSKDFETRFKTLQSSCGSKLAILLIFEGGRVTESVYHKRFKKHRLHGEWFAPHIDVIMELIEEKKERQILAEFWGEEE